MRSSNVIGVTKDRELPGPGDFMAYEPPLPSDILVDTPPQIGLRLSPEVRISSKRKRPLSHPVRTTLPPASQEDAEVTRRLGTPRPLCSFGEGRDPVRALASGTLGRTHLPVNDEPPPDDGWDDRRASLICSYPYRPSAVRAIITPATPMFSYDAAHRVVVCRACGSCVVPGRSNQDRRLRAAPPTSKGHPKRNSAAAGQLRPAERQGAQGAQVVGGGQVPTQYVVVQEIWGRVASLSKSSIEVWNLPQHNAIPIQQIHKESEADITDAWFSTDGRYLLIGYDNGESDLVDPRHGRIEGVGMHNLAV
ncbi:hypothetical protein V502_03445 [Pseudogymnoascus sp. VKM F-4520 (FW-2644)]|nr:hypothetical protein V502_03445 [Pseudogymnoascus sp. VKM F-4520 (FW-2644)]